MISSIKKINLSDFTKKSELLIFPLFSKQAWPKILNDLDKANSKLLQKISKRQGFEGKAGESVSIQVNNGTLQLLLLGMGEQEDLSESWFQAGGNATKTAQNLKTKVNTFVIPEGSSIKNFYDVCLGIHLGSYKFDQYKKDATKPTTQSWHVATSLETKKANNLITRAKTNAESISNARDLVNEPGNAINPQTLAEHAKSIAKENQLKVKILNEAACRKQNMNLFLAVGAGSTANPPLLIHMTYAPKSKSSKRKVFLVGKGVTFDSGGLSLKSGAGMMEMKIDMAGSAAVLSTMKSIAKLKPNFEVHAIVAATENMPDGKSCRPGDIVTGKDGTSVEILNTDAEGRLTLADAITYSKEQGATEIIDLATLTGACMVALGPITAALYSDHKDISEGLLKAADQSHESLWQMPLTKKLNKMIKSPVADLKNIGGSYGGSITAALFLQHFSGDTPWAHLDIAGPAFTKEEEGPITKGATGYGVHTLVEYLSPLEG